MIAFQYDDALLATFPLLNGGVILGRGLRNSQSPDALRAAFDAEQQTVAARWGDSALSDIPALQAWRRAFSRFGVAPTKYRSAAESLMRRVVKKGKIPSINCLVDIGNLISIRYALPISVVDRRNIEGVLTVCFADGTEHYTELHAAEAQPPDVGEVIFRDDAGTVYARRWCWRQSAQSAAQLDTTDVIITIEAQHPDSQAEVAQAIEDILALLQEYAGGEYQAAVLGVTQPAIEDW